MESNCERQINDERVGELCKRVAAAMLENKEHFGVDYENKQVVMHMESLYNIVRQCVKHGIKIGALGVDEYFKPKETKK